MSITDDRRARFVAQMSEAPASVIGNGPMSINAKDGREHVSTEWREEGNEERARNNFLAAANDAPGSLVGSVGCCCPEDSERHLIDAQVDCGKHGDDLRRYQYLIEHQRVTLHRNWPTRPNGLGRA